MIRVMVYTVPLEIRARCGDSPPDPCKVQEAVAEVLGGVGPSVGAVLAHEQCCAHAVVGEPTQREEGITV